MIFESGYGGCGRRPGHRHRHGCRGYGKRCFLLTEASHGVRLTVERLSGDNSFQIKMMEQGVFPGSEIMLLSGSRNQPCLLSTGDNRIMMDSVSAEKILVSQN